MVVTARLAAGCLAALAPTVLGCAATDRPSGDAASEPVDGTPAAHETVSPGNRGMQSPAAPAEVPPNRCVAGVTVRAVADGPARDDLRVRLPDAGDGALATLQLEIESQRPAAEGVESFCVPGAEIRALTVQTDRLPDVGARVDVELEMLGSTEGRHWWLHRFIEPDPDTDPTASGAV